MTEGNRLKTLILIEIHKKIFPMDKHFNNL